MAESTRFHHKQGRRIISVSASSKKAGKSTLASRLVRELDVPAAIKVSSGGAHSPGNPVETDPDVLSRPGTDTGALVAAGAGQVMWVCAPEDELERELRRAMKKLPAEVLLVVEGNSALRYLEPLYAIFLMAVPFEAFKPSALAALARAEVVLVDRSGPLGNEDRRGLKRAIREHAPGVHIIFYRDDDGRELAFQEVVRLARKRLAGD